MAISVYFAPLSDHVELVKQLLVDVFQLDDEVAKNLAINVAKTHFDRLNDDCFLVAESIYIDRVYRDSYYNYYSSKNNAYARDSVRISIFQGEVIEDNFKSIGEVEKLKPRYRGFMILRPTPPQIIGRSVISPKALKSNSFLCCTADIQSTVNAVKFEVEGFPHSSQDGETITCAETTLWAIMEYFGSKYPDYKPVLPSKIINVLKSLSFERQIPSKGLNIQQMSFALKDFGFGTRIYSKAAFGDDFKRLLSCYVESGIPLILGIDDFDKGGGIGHAVVCIGHEKITSNMVTSLNATRVSDPDHRKIISSRKLTIFDWDDIDKRFVFIDDNCPIYEMAYLTKPTAHYPPSWANCEIKYIIVPLYPKIYLEAFEAKKYVLDLIVSGPLPVADNSEVFVRFYLSSSRSYKSALALNPTFQANIKEMILEIPMPKFVWVAELSSKSLIQNSPQMAAGLVILDATEVNTAFNKPIVFAAYGDKLFKQEHRKLGEYVVSLQPFSVYNNLRTI